MINYPTHAPPPAPLPSHSPPTHTTPPPPLPATGTAFKCPSPPHCRDKLPDANAAGYIHHLNSRHTARDRTPSASVAASPISPHVATVTSSVLMLKASPHNESARTRNLRFPGLKRTKTYLKSSCLTSSSVLCTTFTASGVPPPIPYRPPSLPGHTCGVTGGGIEVYTDVSPPPWPVTECHFSK